MVSGPLAGTGFVQRTVGAVPTKTVQNDCAAARTVYAGRWLLADDPQFCGRAIVVKQAENLRSGVELLYFGEESADPYFGERYFTDHGEATRSAEQMLLRFLGGRYRRRHSRTSSPAVTLPAVVNGVNDGHVSGPGREAA